MSHTSIDHIAVNAHAGSPITQALREAAALAFSENRDVILQFNDKKYLIDVAKILEGIEMSK